MFGVICTGFVEMFSVASILPFIAVVSKPEVIETNIYLNMVYTSLSFSEPKYFILFLGVFVFSLLFFGNAFSALSTRGMLKFSYFQGCKISAKLLGKYLSQPYTYFLEKNSVYLQKNIISEVDRFVSGIVINAGLTFSKMVVGASILGLLIAVDYKLALTIMVVIGGTYFVVYSIVRKKLTLAGQLASEYNIERYQAVKEVLGGIKELKILNRESLFQSRFYNATRAHAEFEATYQLMPLMTKYLIEVVALGGMLLVAVYLILVKDSLNQYLPLLALYALAAYRIMPAAQQLFSGIASAKYNSVAVNILYDDLNITGEYKQSTHSKLEMQHFFTLENISYAYPGAQRQVIDNISLNIAKFSKIGLVGSSGAGKTTLVDLILGLLQPESGTMKVDGARLTLENFPAWQRNIGYVPQNIFLVDSTILENIALGVAREDIDNEKVYQAAKLANLHEFIHAELVDGYETNIGENGMRLSGGQRQRIGIARALYHEPQLLIFDEATSALDNQTEKVIVESIHNLSEKKTIIIIAHRLQTVKNCDAIYLLNRGKVEDSGTYQELILRNTDFRRSAELAV